MKTLTQDEIESLLGIHASNIHPLDILGYGYTSEGARRFRAEQPDFVPQIVAYIHSVLVNTGLFPKDMDLSNPGFRTFIRTDDGVTFSINSAEEVGVSKFERISTRLMSQNQAIHEYIRKVANPDYIYVAECRDEGRC